MTITIDAIRDHFPAVQHEISGKPVIYLDSAATYLKPRPVIEAVTECYENMAGTVGRGVHVMAEIASKEYDLARETIANFINADTNNVIFVRNATEALNLIASGLDPGSKVLGSPLEHHSNLLPWRKHHQFHTIKLLSNGSVDLDDLQKCLSTIQPTALTFSIVGNAFGTVQPVDQIIELAHAADCDVILDANQVMAHQSIDVNQLDCDYLSFSGHKLGGPTGIGVLYAKKDRLQRLKPMLYGGGMVETVDAIAHALADPPMRFEAGTPAFEGAIGLAAACEFFEDIGLGSVAEHEHRLVQQLIERLNLIPHVSVQGPTDADQRGAIVSFHIDGLEAHGAARMLAKSANICVRSGFHCAEPAHKYFEWRPTIRASFGVYNTLDEVNMFTDAVEQITTNLF